MRDTVYFNRKVVALRDPSLHSKDGPEFLSNYPKQGPAYPKLVLPNRYHLHPLIPVVDNEALPLSTEELELPREGTVYFELKQSAYNFEGTEGPIKTLLLVPSVVAVCVQPPSQLTLSRVQSARRRRGRRIGF